MKVVEEELFHNRVEEFVRVRKQCKTSNSTLDVLLFFYLIYSC